MCKTRVSVALAILGLWANAVLAAPPAPASLAKLYVTAEVAQSGKPAGKAAVTGMVADKVRAVLDRSHVAYEIVPLPWKRAYAKALGRPDGCVFPTTRTPDREQEFKWMGPVAEASWVLMARADRHFKFDNLEQTRGLRIGTYHGDARDHFLRERGMTVEAASNDMLNIAKLLQGRIDLWAASVRSDLIGAPPGLDKHIVPVLEFHRSGLYLACNRAVPDSVVERINAEFQAMQRDGTMRRIERKYRNAGAVVEPDATGSP